MAGSTTQYLRGGLGEFGFVTLGATRFAGEINDPVGGWGRTR